MNGRVGAAIAGVLMVAWASSAAGAEVDFEREIAPLFKQHCQKCHGTEKQQGGLRFDTSAGAIREGDSGEKAIVPGKAEASELIRRVTSEDESEWMPPEGDRLSRGEIELLRRWIDQEARWPESAIRLATGRELKISDEDRQHWSYRPLRSPAVPPVERTEAARTEIDRFILAELEPRGVNSPRLRRLRWRRRGSFPARRSHGRRRRQAIGLRWASSEWGR